MVLPLTPKQPQKVPLFKKRRFHLYHFKQKSLFLLPNLFSLGNAFFGFCSLIFIAREALVAGAYAILLGGLMDMLDGRIARYTGNSSAIGVQLDSLCDAVSFCVAPAFLMYFWQLKTFGIFGFLGCVFFLLTGIFRLARFNITHGAQAVYFLGIPTTIAACTLIVIFLNFENITFTCLYSWLLCAVVTLLGFLMISSFKFPTLKHLKKRWYTLGMLTAVAVNMILGFIKVSLIALCCYFLFVLIENIRLAFFSRTHSSDVWFLRKSN
jgi:CDP-diacylglycerol--serine O-phosphatidyltransferase